MDLEEIVRVVLGSEELAVVVREVVRECLDECGVEVVADRDDVHLGDGRVLGVGDRASVSLEVAGLLERRGMARRVWVLGTD